MSLSRLFSALAAVLFIAVLTVSASAGSITFTAVLSGANETTPNSSTATGTATVTIDDITGAGTISLGFTGLSTPLTGAHIHCCAAQGANAPVIVGFDAFLTLTPNRMSGSIANYAFTLTAAQVTAMTNGLTYVNVHTNQFGGGEIRGQLVAGNAGAPVPEPGTLLLFGTGLFSVASMMKRRRK